MMSATVSIALAEIKRNLRQGSFLIPILLIAGISLFAVYTASNSYQLQLNDRNKARKLMRDKFLSQGEVCNCLSLI